MTSQKVEYRHLQIIFENGARFFSECLYHEVLQTALWESWHCFQCFAQVCLPWVPFTSRCGLSSFLRKIHSWLWCHVAMPSVVSCHVPWLVLFAPGCLFLAKEQRRGHNSLSGWHTGWVEHRHFQINFESGAKFVSECLQHETLQTMLREMYHRLHWCFTQGRLPLSTLYFWMRVSSFVGKGQLPSWHLCHVICVMLIFFYYFVAYWIF